MDQKTAKMKNDTIIGLSGMVLVTIMSAGILLPPRAFAQDAYEKVLALAEEDCKKIAERFGEQVPGELIIGGVGIDTYSAGCGFSHTNEGVEYDVQQIEDMKLFIGGFGFRRYDTSQAAQQSIRRSINASGPERKTHTIETSDGSLYLLKSPLFYGSEFQKTHTASIDIVKGSCVVGVTSYSQYRDGEYRGEGYHLSTGNRHPGFNHDREADMLKLIRQKAEEIFSVVDCGEDTTPSPSDAPTPIDWPKCFAECPVVTASKDCIITPDTRPSEMQCLRDLLNSSLACQNTCIAKMPEKECSADAPPMQFPEINFGGRQYFTNNPAIIDLISPDDLTQMSISSDLPEVKDINNKVFDNSAGSISNPLKNQASVWGTEGQAVDILLPGETEWHELKKNDPIPSGSRIFTGMDSDILIYLGSGGVVKAKPFTDFIFDQNLVDESCKEGSRTPLIHHLDLRDGEVEVQVEQGTYQGSMQVTTPSATNAVRGTHFWVSYDATKNISATGVYEGAVAVTDRATGAAMELKPMSDGTPGIAILGSASSEQPEQTKNGNGLFWIITLLVICGGVFWFHKKGKKVDDVV